MSRVGLNHVGHASRIFAASSGGSVRVAGIEVVQAVQNLAQEVRLITGKRTVVRVYCQPDSMPRSIRVRGELAVSRAPGAPQRYITSANEVSLRKADLPELQAQRKDARLSLNFVIPAPSAGSLHVSLNRLIPVANGDDVPLLEDGRSNTVSFEHGTSLRIRVIGLRYQDKRVNPPKSYAPDALHFEMLRSYITRAYPVPAVEWSQIVVPAGENIAPPFSDGTEEDLLWRKLGGRALIRLETLRQADVNAGRDPRTHYYGLIADDGGFFRGRATKVAGQPDPSVVAFGPTGRPAQTFWDKDGSYGDWYGAHELGHTFGCRHPGCPEQARDPQSTFPYPNGALSDAAEDCVGFDVGDPSLGLPMRALPRQESADFMTYCANQWISRHTYDAIFTRLQQEGERFAPLTG